MPKLSTQYEGYKNYCIKQDREPLSYEEWLKEKTKQKIVTTCKKCKKGIV